MLNHKIGMIGGGNMGSALIGGLIRQGWDPKAIFVSDHGAATCERLKATWGVNASTNHHRMVSRVEVIILAVKPQQMHTVVADLAPQLERQARSPLLISIAAGIQIAQIQKWLQIPLPLIRAMPNAPALLGCGITGLFPSPHLTPPERQLGENLLKAFGETIWLPEENLMDVVTALAGSGPGYFFYLLENMIQGGIELGLPADIAKKLTLQTAFGSVQMALQTQETLPQLQQKVTSPGGTTEQGINVLKNGKLPDLLKETLRAATARGKALSKQFD